MRRRMNWPYRFPLNRRAKKLSLTNQVGYIEGELEEVKTAILRIEGDSRVIEELWDVIQAAEGALRKFPLIDVIKGLARVKLKSLHRGDYVKWEDR